MKSWSARIKDIFRPLLFPVILLLISVKDYFILKRGKKIIIILCYHRVNDVDNDPMTVHPEVFADQVRLLKKHYRVLSAADLLEWLDYEGNDRPGKGLVITFDDGYEDNYKVALPILQSYSCPAIFFATTGYIDNEKQFPHDRKRYPETGFKKMNWQQLKEAAQAGIEIGIHSDTHIDFGSSPYDEVVREIETSLKKYEDYFDRKSVLMAYPFGARENITEELRDYVRKHDRIAALFAAYGGKNISPFDKYDIKRRFIGNSDRGLLFLYRTEGGFRYLFNRNRQDG